MEGHIGFSVFYKYLLIQVHLLKIFSFFLVSMWPAPSKNLRCQVSNGLPWAKASHNHYCWGSTVLCVPLMGGREHEEKCTWIPPDCLCLSFPDDPAAESLLCHCNKTYSWVQLKKCVDSSGFKVWMNKTETQVLVRLWRNWNPYPPLMGM